MSNVGYATLQVIPSMRGVDATLKSQLSAPAAAAGEDAGKKAGSGFASGMGTAIKAVGAFVIGQQIGSFFKSAFSEAQESIKVGAQTVAVLKSQGGQAGITAKQVNDLANSLSKKAGIDDEVIQSGENMLLTFRNIRNESGKGNDIFNQTTQATLDMAVAMKSANGGQVDLKGTSILLGKALNDPVQGLTALQRVGVRLTDQQKYGIGVMVAQGDTLGAQKVILGEVTKEFGGSAAAQATAADKAGVAWKNLQETIGLLLIPVIQKLTDILVPIFEYLSTHQTVLLAIAGVIGGALVAAFVAWAISATGAAIATIAATWPIIAAAVVVAALAAGIIWLWTNWDQVWGWIRDHPAYAIVIGLIGTLITGGILPLIIGAIWLAKNWDDVWAAISGAVSTAWDFVSGVFDEVVSHLTIIGYAAGLIKGVWDGMFDGIKTAWHAVSGVVDGIINTLGDIADAAGKVKDALSDFGGGVLDTVDPAHLVHRAGGGPVRGGTYIVGERGPELLQLGAGSSGHVTNASDTAKALSAASRGSGIVVQGDLVVQDTSVVSDLDFWARTRATGP